MPQKPATVAPLCSSATFPAAKYPHVCFKIQPLLEEEEEEERERERERERGREGDLNGLPSRTSAPFLPPLPSLLGHASKCNGRVKSLKSLFPPHLATRKHVLQYNMQTEE